MAAPYLVEVRTGGEVKQQLRSIIYDVADKFGVRGAAEPRAIPHITLFGPYNTNNGKTVQQELLNVFSNFDVVPYQIDGFGSFPENNVIYAEVVPSPELRELRREISRNLRPLSYNYRPWDSKFFYDFHITIAFKDVSDDQFDAIWQYVTGNYDPEFDEYATRISNLRRGDMMWEYDLPAGIKMDSDEATSKSSWERTMAKLEKRTKPEDHSDCGSGPTGVQRWITSLGARVMQNW